MDDRGQPAGKEIEDQKVHEKHDPEEHGAYTPGLPEEMAHREAAEALFMGGEPRPGAEGEFRVDAPEDASDTVILGPLEGEQPDRFGKGKDEDRQEHGAGAGRRPRRRRSIPSAG